MFPPFFHSLETQTYCIVLICAVLFVTWKQYDKTIGGSNQIHNQSQNNSTRKRAHCSEATLRSTVPEYGCIDWKLKMENTIYANDTKQCAKVSGSSMENMALKYEKRGKTH